MFLEHTAAPAPRLYECSLPSANLRVDASRLDGWPVDHVLNRFPGRVPGVRTVVEFRLVAGGDLSLFYRLDLGLTQKAKRLTASRGLGGAARNRQPGTSQCASRSCGALWQAGESSRHLRLQASPSGIG